MDMKFFPVIMIIMIGSSPIHSIGIGNRENVEFEGCLLAFFPYIDPRQCRLRGCYCVRVGNFSLLFHGISIVSVCVFLCSSFCLYFVLHALLYFYSSDVVCFIRE